MDAKALSAKLAGSEYPVRLAKELEAEAKGAGLVIVFGASDDLMEFRGAIHDEIGAYNGTVAAIDAAGLIPDFDQIDKDGPGAKDELRAYFKREGCGREIAAIWDRDGYSWQYQTSIPHETFEVVEDGEPYCRGLVFALADVATH